MRWGLLLTGMAPLLVGVAACGSNGRFDGGDAGGADAPCAFCGLDSGDSGPSSRCSPDLHEVLDSMGGVVTTCPPTLACANGTCVPACQAAASAKGSIGCDFMVATPSFDASGFDGYSSPCFAVFVANNWGEDTVVTVDRGGTTYNVPSFGRISSSTVAPPSWASIPAAGISQGQVGVLFMASDPSSDFTCPVSPALLQDTAVQGTGIGTAWHITTSYPVSAYDILPFGGASSLLPGATLLYPTTAWGRNYIAALPALGSGQEGQFGGPHWGQIVAFQDGTSVDVVPTVALPSGGGVMAAPQNVKTTFTLNAGDFIQWQPGYTFGPGEVAPMDMSGSIISSNNPIAFNSGNGYLCLGSATTTGGGCDSEHEQIAPIQALGSTYAIVPYEPRAPYTPANPESVIYRFTGVANGTTLTYDPPEPTLPTTLSLGQVVQFESTKEFLVSSQDANHPFHVALMMPGCNGENAIGDEDYTQLVPPAQFLPSYVFYSDVTYGYTNFTVVRNKTSNGFNDVTIDCVGTVTGWTPVDSADTYEYAWVDILKAGVSQYMGCLNGPHSAQSKSPFGITVWGEDSYASYGYPAGGTLSSINPVVVAPVPQ